MKRWLLNLFRRTPAARPVPPVVKAMLVSQEYLTRAERMLKHVQELIGPTLPAPEDAPEWAAEDTGALLQFLRGQTGAKLLLTMRRQEELLKAAACDDTEKRVDHARGQAVGYRKGIATLIVLSAPPPPKEETAASQDSGDSQLRDQLSHS